MKDKIIIVKRETKSSSAEIARFKQKALAVCTTQVKMHVKQASKTDLPKGIIVCNNPV